MSFPAISLSGFVSLLVGVYLNWGLGWAFTVAGVLLFVAGGIGSAREGR